MKRTSQGLGSPSTALGSRPLYGSSTYYGDGGRLGVPNTSYLGPGCSEGPSYTRRSATPSRFDRSTNTPSRYEGATGNYFRSLTPVLTGASYKRSKETACNADDRTTRKPKSVTSLEEYSRQERLHTDQFSNEFLSQSKPLSEMLKQSKS